MCRSSTSCSPSPAGQPSRYGQGCERTGTTGAMGVRSMTRRVLAPRAGRSCCSKTCCYVHGLGPPCQLFCPRPGLRLANPSRKVSLYMWDHRLSEGRRGPSGFGRAHSALPFVLVFVSAPPLHPAKEKTMQVAESPGSTPIRGGAVPGSWMAHRTPNFYRLCPPEKRCGFG